jgi:protein-S-isoprenylcysteine O-methyltransferase Ste14
VTRAALGTLLFTLTVPGTVVGLVPYWLTGWRLSPSGALRALGALVILAALPVFLAFLWRFVREGLGTPAPIAPTARLVVGGPFRFVRNPGYIAVVAMVAGQGILFGRGALLGYAALLALGFHLFVVGYEEPTLRRQFGAEYDAYCRRVPRWWPRVSGLVLVALALGCAATRVETQWADPAATAPDFAFQRVIAIAQLEDESTRRAAEDELVRLLAARPQARARGMQAAPSYPLITSGELGDVAAMRAKVEGAGFDGAVVMRLVASDERITDVPGSYEVRWGRVVSYQPGYTRVDRIVRVETAVFSIALGKRLWSGVTSTLNPRDLPELLDDVARAIGKELEAKGLAP